MYGLVSPYRVVSNAREKNTPYEIVAGVKQDFQLALIPIFQFAIFYTIDLEINRMNSYVYVNGLLRTNTDERGLVRTFTWDSLKRLTSINYPDGTYESNRYDKLDLLFPDNYEIHFSNQPQKKVSIHIHKLMKNEPAV